MARQRTPIAAPPAAPPRVGLIKSANVPQGKWDERGIEYGSEGCQMIETLADRACEPSEDKAPGTSGNAVEWDPYILVAADSCSALGFGARDWQGRARRLLLACESAQIEAELWNGTIADDEDLPNRALASEASDVLTSGPTGFTDALACLEQGLAECNCGQRGMIHAPRQLVTHWVALNLIRREGNFLLTALDTIVVPGAGYDGSGPYAAASEGSIWAYGTGIVDVRLGEIQIYGGPNREGLDRTTNDIEIRAERKALASWDGCCHVAVEIDASLCGIGGAGS